MPKKRTFAEELAAFEALKKKRKGEKAAAKAAGKSDAQIAYERRLKLEAANKRPPKKTSPPTAREQRTAKAAKTRQGIMEKLPPTGLQRLQDVLAPKSKKKKR